MKHTFYEFFAGGGMARAGLGSDWECLFANDFDLKRRRFTRTIGGWSDCLQGTSAEVTLSELPGQADLIWVHFPAKISPEAGGNFQGDRSGAFNCIFGNSLRTLDPKIAGKILVLENVFGTLRSHGGRDFAAIGESAIGRRL
ncbi:MAG: hypothetical protein R3F11_31300 [Verrucomicrobiales bacterium]